MGGLRERWDRPSDRLTILIAIVVLLFSAAVIVAIVRYSNSRDADRKALDEAQTQFYAQQVRTDITDEGGIADAYGGDADPADLEDLDGVKRSLAQALRSLKESPGLQAEESGIVHSIAAGQRRLESIFRDQLVPVAGTPNFDEGVFPYNEQVGKVEKQIDAFNRASAQQVAEASSDANSTASSARTAAIVAAILAAAFAIAIGFYVVRLVSRLLNRISSAAAYGFTALSKRGVPATARTLVLKSESRCLLPAEMERSTASSAGSVAAARSFVRAASISLLAALMPWRSAGSLSTA